MRHACYIMCVFNIYMKICVCKYYIVKFLEEYIYQKPELKQKNLSIIIISDSLYDYSVTIIISLSFFQIYITVLIFNLCMFFFIKLTTFFLDYKAACRFTNALELQKHESNIMSNIHESENYIRFYILSSFTYFAIYALGSVCNMHI